MNKDKDFINETTDEYLTRIRKRSDVPKEMTEEELKEGFKKNFFEDSIEELIEEKLDEKYEEIKEEIIKEQELVGANNVIDNELDNNQETKNEENELAKELETFDAIDFEFENDIEEMYGPVKPMIEVKKVETEEEIEEPTDEIYGPVKPLIEVRSVEEEPAEKRLTIVEHDKTDNDKMDKKTLIKMGLAALGVIIVMGIVTKCQKKSIPTKNNTTTPIEKPVPSDFFERDELNVKYENANGNFDVDSIIRKDGVIYSDREALEKADKITPTIKVVDTMGGVVNPDGTYTIYENTFESKELFEKIKSGSDIVLEEKNGVYYEYSNQKVK